MENIENMGDVLASLRALLHWSVIVINGDIWHDHMFTDMVKHISQATIPIKVAKTSDNSNCATMACSIPLGARSPTWDCKEYILRWLILLYVLRKGY